MIEGPRASTRRAGRNHNTMPIKVAIVEDDQRLRESQRLVDLAQEAGHVGFFHYRFAEGSLAWTAGQAMLFGIEERPPGGSLQDWSERIDAADRVVCPGFIP